MGRSVVISAHNEAETVAEVVLQARAAGADEVLVVANGSTDGTPYLAQAAGAQVHFDPRAYGHDVARAVGATLVQGEAVLFLDADFVVPCRDLWPFFHAVEYGVDVALNDLNWQHRTVPAYDWVSQIKGVLNRATDRPDLGLASLTAVPHALSRRALELLGPYLAVPPLAQVIAILQGLQVRPVHAVDVSRNRLRPGVNTGGDSPPVENLILGDHLEGLGFLFQARGPRGGFTDLDRRQELVNQFAAPPAQPPAPPAIPTPVATPTREFARGESWAYWTHWKPVHRAKEHWKPWG